MFFFLKELDCGSWKWSEVAQSCPTLCNPMDCGPPGSSVRGLLQARMLEWVAISFSRGSPWPRDWTGSPALQADALLSEPPGKPLKTSRGTIEIVHVCVQSCLTFFDSMDCSLLGFSVLGIFQQEYWHGSPFLSPGDLSNPGIEPVSSALARGFFTTGPPGKLIGRLIVTKVD